MSKILFFSDIHIHPFKPYSFITDDGINSRLQDGIDVLDGIHELAREHNVDLIIFGGDLFHERYQVDTVALNLAFNKLATMSLEFPLLMITGNHDQADKNGQYHLMDSFKIFAHVVDKPGWEIVRGREEEYLFYCLPYVEDLDRLREQVHEPNPFKEEGLPTLFLGHLGINGAKLGADFVYKHPIEPELNELNPERFDAGFLGHFHLPQYLGHNFQYIGAPMQHNWSDRGQERHVIICDIEDRVCLNRCFELESPPEFVLLDTEMNLDILGHLENDYVRFLSDKEWSGQDKEQFIKKHGCRSLEIIPKTSCEIDTSERISFKKAASHRDILIQYATSGVEDLDGLDEQYLINMGLEAFNEISDD